MRKLLALPVLSAMALPAVAFAQATVDPAPRNTVVTAQPAREVRYVDTQEVGVQQGDMLLTLSGSAANGPDFDAVTISAAAKFEYAIADNFTIGAKQAIGYTDAGAASSALNASTSIGTWYHFGFDNFVPYIGANLGYTYGDAVSDTWFLSPEAGVKYYVNEETFVFLSVEYQWFFDDTDEIDDSFSDGQFIYQLGVGFEL
jgi:outer membrane protein W